MSRTPFGWVVPRRFILLTSVVRHGPRHPWQLALALLGVSLGVAAVVAIDLAITSATRAFSLANEAVSGRATHQDCGRAPRCPRVGLCQATPRRAGDSRRPNRRRSRARPGDCEPAARPIPSPNPASAGGRSPGRRPLSPASGSRDRRSVRRGGVALDLPARPRSHAPRDRLRSRPQSRFRSRFRCGAPAQRHCRWPPRDLALLECDRRGRSVGSGAASRSRGRRHRHRAGGSRSDRMAIANRYIDSQPGPSATHPSRAWRGCYRRGFASCRRGEGCGWRRR